MKGIVAKVSESVFESVVPVAGSTKDQVILALGLRFCGVNEEFDSKDSVHSTKNQDALFATLQTLGVC